MKLPSFYHTTVHDNDSMNEMLQRPDSRSSGTSHAVVQACTQPPAQLSLRLTEVWGHACTRCLEVLQVQLAARCTRACWSTDTCCSMSWRWTLQVHGFLLAIEHTKLYDVQLHNTNAWASAIGTTNPHMVARALTKSFQTACLKQITKSNQ